MSDDKTVLIPKRSTGTMTVTRLILNPRVYDEIVGTAAAVFDAEEDPSEGEKELAAMLNEHRPGLNAARAWFTGHNSHLPDGDTVVEEGTIEYARCIPAGEEKP